jgi:hypothetical protein
VDTRTLAALATLRTFAGARWTLASALKTRATLASPCAAFGALAAALGALGALAATLEALGALSALAATLGALGALGATLEALSALGATLGALSALGATLKACAAFALEGASGLTSPLSSGPLGAQITVSGEVAPVRRAALLSRLVLASRLALAKASRGLGARLGAWLVRLALASVAPLGTLGARTCRARGASCFPELSLRVSGFLAGTTLGAFHG